jgi:hypothetical protein
MIMENTYNIWYVGKHDMSDYATDSAGGSVAKSDIMPVVNLY